MLKQYLLAAVVCATTFSLSAQTIMNIDGSRRGPKISDYQYGLFLEEINHAGEGGLYAELVKNRSFEQGLDAWTSFNGATIKLQTTDLLRFRKRRSRCQSLEQALLT